MWSTHQRLFLHFDPGVHTRSFTSHVSHRLLNGRFYLGRLGHFHRLRNRLRFNDRRRNFHGFLPAAFLLLSGGGREKSLFTLHNLLRLWRLLNTRPRTGRHLHPSLGQGLRTGRWHHHRSRRRLHRRRRHLPRRGKTHSAR